MTRSCGQDPKDTTAGVRFATKKSPGNYCCAHRLLKNVEHHSHHFQYSQQKTPIPINHSSTEKYQLCSYCTDEEGEKCGKCLGVLKFDETLIFDFYSTESSKSFAGVARNGNGKRLTNGLSIWIDLYRLNSPFCKKMFSFKKGGPSCHGGLEALVPGLPGWRTQPQPKRLH